MNITPIIFFDMIAAILILALALIAIVFYLSRITKNLHNNIYMKNDNSLDEARAKAIKIIDDANNHALDIISKITLSTSVSSENFKENLSRTSSIQIEKFKKATSDFTALYSQVLQDLKIKNIEVFQNISKDIEVNTTEEIKNFKDSIQKLTIASQDEVRKKIDDSYKISKEEIESYKKKEMQKIDSRIYELLEKMSKLVLGRAINLSEHEDLIEKSLEKAKKEGIFN